MKREDLIQTLHVTEQEDLISIYDKLFVAALMPEGTVVIERVLTRYLNYKKCLRGDRNKFL